MMMATLTTNFTYSVNKIAGSSDSDQARAIFTYDSNGRLVSAIEKYYDYHGLLIAENVTFSYDI